MLLDAMLLEDCPRAGFWYGRVKTIESPTARFVGDTVHSNVTADVKPAPLLP